MAKKEYVTVECPQCETSISFAFSEFKRDWDLQLTCGHCDHKFYAEQALLKVVQERMKARGYPAPPIPPHMPKGVTRHKTADGDTVIIRGGPRPSLEVRKKQPPVSCKKR